MADRLTNRSTYGHERSSVWYAVEPKPTEIIVNRRAARASPALGEIQGIDYSIFITPNILSVGSGGVHHLPIDQCHELINMCGFL